MSDQTITSLIEKLEGAEVGSRELDCLLATSAGGFVIKGELYGKPAYCRQDDDGSWSHPGQSGDQMVPRYTTSLDAALALADRVGIRPYIADASIKGKWSWMVVDEARLGDLEANPYARATATTPALALCAAILRAQSESRATGEDSPANEGEGA